MAHNVMKAIYIVILCLTIVFAIVELGLAADLTRGVNRTYLGFGARIRPRTRYLVYCSTWSIIAGIVLLMFMVMADAVMAITIQVVVMFMSMIFWILGASLFTSSLGGSGLNCAPGFINCTTVNIINATLAFAWINWSFVMIGFLLTLWLAFFGRHRQQKDTPRNQMGTTNAPPVSNRTANGAAPTQQPPA